MRMIIQQVHEPSWIFSFSRHSSGRRHDLKKKGEQERPIFNPFPNTWLWCAYESPSWAPATGEPNSNSQA